MFTDEYATATPIITLGGCLTAVLDMNACLAYTDRELTLQDQTEQGETSRLYPMQLILDAWQWRDMGPGTSPHWSSDMNQLAQICWRIHPERFCEVIDTNSPDSSTDNIEVGSLILCSLGKILKIVAARGLYLIDPGSSFS